jgi:protein ImuB
VFAAKALADRIDNELIARGQICTRIVVEAESEHGEFSRRVWYRAEGLRSPAMVDRVRWQLDGWINGTDPPSAGVILLRLAPTDLRADSGRQQGFWGERSRADDDAAKAITRVTGLLGPQSVRVASWHGGRDPHDIYELVPVSDVGADGRHLLDRPDDPPPWPGSLPSPSPAVIHPEPIEIDVLDADGRRVMVNGRGFISSSPNLVVRPSERSSVLQWAGPWPVDERWWDRRSRRAARFQMVIDDPLGPRAVLAEISGGRWFVVGEYQ